MKFYSHLVNNCWLILFWKNWLIKCWNSLKTYWTFQIFDVTCTTCIFSSPNILVMICIVSSQNTKFWCELKMLLPKQNESWLSFCMDTLFFRFENGKENINQSSNCAWWGFNASGFFWARGTRSVPWLLCRFRLRVRFGRLIGLPCWSTGWGHRAWCRISQHCFVALGLQTYTIPVTSLVHDRQNVLGLLLQEETMHCPWKGPVSPDLLKIWFPASSGKIGIESNS